MQSNQIIKGFSKFDKEKKINVVSEYLPDSDVFIEQVKSFWHRDKQLQQRFDEFSENTITNYYFPYGIAPNFLIDGKIYLVPMVIEESSVVAAASSGAKFWAMHGGFSTEIISTTKIGNLYFYWEGPFQQLQAAFPQLRQRLIDESRSVTANMEKRGGGIRNIELIDMSHQLDNMYQLKASFETVNSMGANFINSCLEEFASILKGFFAENTNLAQQHRECTIIMAILSNYTPDCLVKSRVECPIEALGKMDDELTAKEFAWKFEQAVRIAQIDPHRAATHNKGVFNGVDAVALSTGNDFRAIEACGHAYAARNGQYSSLTEVEVTDRTFAYTLTLPLALGTVGGLTALHPMAKRSLELLGNPSAHELMRIAASAGLANNFSAIKSLITKGIQKGHMKMHLLNILNHFNATADEKQQAIQYFNDKKVAFAKVGQFLETIRTK